MSSFLDGTGLSHLLEKIKSAFVAKADTTAVTSIGIDSTPTASSSNLVTSGGVYTAVNAKQNTLVSGTNIKTINSTSLLGSGDITISGGGDFDPDVDDSDMSFTDEIVTKVLNGTYGFLGNALKLGGAVNNNGTLTFDSETGGAVLEVGSEYDSSSLSNFVLYDEEENIISYSSATRLRMGPLEPYLLKITTSGYFITISTAESPVSYSYTHNVNDR